MRTRIEIGTMVFQKIMHWINKSDKEVSGLGKITYKDGVIQVTDAILLPQKNGATHTDIEGVDVAKAMFLLKDAPGDLRFWWHSHVDMPVFWSGTDWDTIEKISAGGWFVSTVFNKRREMRSCLRIAQPMDFGAFDELPTQIVQFLDQEEIKRWDAEYDKNVTEMVRPPYSWVKKDGYQPNEYHGGKDGGQLTLPGEYLPEEERERAGSEDERTGWNSDDGPTEIDFNDPYFNERPNHRVRRGSPPTDGNGHTGGW